MRFHVEIVRGNLMKTIQRLERMAPARDFSPAPEMAGRYICETVNRRWFESSGMGAWPLSKRAEKTGGRTLIDTRALYQAATVPQSAKSDFSDWYRKWHEAWNVFRLTPTRVDVGVRGSQVLILHAKYKVLSLFYDPSYTEYIVRNWMKWARRTFALSETGGL